MPTLLDLKLLLKRGYIEVFSYVFCSNGRIFQAMGKSEQEVIDSAFNYFFPIIEEFINMDKINYKALE